MNRIDRLTAILIQLQTKRVVKAEEIADRFEISLRTVYRDVKALMEAGVPIGSEAGKGYFIVDGFHLPPVMFTESEASSLMLAGKLVEKMTDKSVQAQFESALNKIRSVLRDNEKDHLEVLQSNIEVWQQGGPEKSISEPFLNDIQKAVVSKEILSIEYLSNSYEVTTREVEPIGLFYYGMAWHLIAWCKLRNGYRDFRVDRIKSLRNTSVKFDARNLISLKEYLSTIVQKNDEMLKISVLFDKSSARFVGNMRYNFGFVSEEEHQDRIRMTFLTCYLKGIARWLIAFGTTVEVEGPDVLQDMLEEIADEIYHHYKGIAANVD